MMKNKMYRQRRRGKKIACLCLVSLVCLTSASYAQAKRAEELIQELKHLDLHAHWKMRRAAIDYLIKIGKPAVKPLIAALRDKSVYGRISAAEALGEIKDIRAVDPLIIALKDKDTVVKEEAAVALGKIKDTRAVKPLIAALKDKSWAVREKAINALGKMGDARAIEPLDKLTQNDPHIFIREIAQEVLAKIRGK